MNEEDAVSKHVISPAQLAPLHHGRAVHDKLGDQVTRLLTKCDADVSVCVAESMLEAGSKRNSLNLRFEPR